MSRLDVPSLYCVSLTMSDQDLKHELEKKRITFGQFKGRTYKHVCFVAPKYVEYLIRTATPPRDKSSEETKQNWKRVEELLTYAKLTHLFDYDFDEDEPNNTGGPAADGNYPNLTPAVDTNRVSNDAPPAAKRPKW